MIFPIDPNSSADMQYLEMFVQQVQSPFFRYFRKRTAKEAVLNHKLTLVDIQDKSVRGYAHIDYDINSNRDFLGVCVLDKYQSLGIGTSLLKTILEFADINKLELYLSVDKENTIARKLYEKLGFTLQEERENFDFYIRRLRPANIQNGLTS